MGVWNLLRFDVEEEYKTDIALNPALLGPAVASITPDVKVIQFKSVDAYYWVMVTTVGLQRLIDNHIALQYDFSPGGAGLLYANTSVIIDPNGIVVEGFFGPGIPGAQPPEKPADLIPQTPPYKLIANLVTATPTNIIHNVWYLLGYPDDRTANLDGNLIRTTAAEFAGTIQPVSIFADTTGNSVVPQPGVWILVTIPTIVGSDGKLMLSTLAIDNWCRLIFDISANTIVYSTFNQTRHLQIMSTTGAFIFDGVPIIGLRQPINFTIPSSPKTAQTAYRASGVFFDGGTGLVTSKGQELLTRNTATVSFAGWLRASWLANVPDGQTTATLRFSQGNAGDSIFVDDSNLDSSGWHHYIGTINGADGTSAFMVDGIQTQTMPGTTGTVPFIGVVTDGKRVYIGTDGQGNFFTGDMADFSIWYDLNFINGGTIQANIVAAFIDDVTGLPVYPFSAFAFLKQSPDIFIAGPAAFITSLPFQIQVSALNSQPAPGVSGLAYLEGNLEDSTSSPSDHGIVPA